MILKVQRPLRTNDPREHWLFYNQSRTYFTTRAPTEDEKRIMGKEFKIFAEYKNGSLVKKVPYEGW